MAEFGPLIDATRLRGELHGDDLALVDLRWYLDGRPGRAAYEAGHIPGAVFVDLDTDITGAGGAGRHPLPGRAQFETAMRRAGVDRGDRVVIYDDQGGFSAARLWWLLKLFGHHRAAVLDGGLASWDGPVASGIEPDPAPGDFVASEPDAALYLTFEEVAALPSEVRLVDARAPERYRGDVEPIDPRPGHIPGAVNVPWSANLGPDRRFLPPESLRALYQSAGAEADVVVYCGSGVSAAVDVIAREVAGLPPARLYAGSWSDWSRHPQAPAALGGE